MKTSPKLILLALAVSSILGCSNNRGIEEIRPILNANTVSSMSNINMLITIDTSESMNAVSNDVDETHLEVVKKAILDLLDAASRKGRVMVKLVTFSTNASVVGDSWMSVEQAKQFVKSLKADEVEGQTNFDDALAKAQDAFYQPGKISNATNVSYFFSDGIPNAGMGDITTLTGFLNESRSDAGIQFEEELSWKKFLNTNSIKSYAIGVSSDASEEYLDPVAWNGVLEKELGSQIVVDLSMFSDIVGLTLYSFEKPPVLTAKELNHSNGVFETKTEREHVINVYDSIAASNKNMMWLFNGLGKATSLHPTDIDAIIEKINSSKLIAYFTFNNDKPIKGFSYTDENMSELAKAKEVIVVGHTDDFGTDVYNMDLGERRAKSIKNWLTEKGVNESKITIISMGEREPVASNKTPEGRAKNRRVEVYARN